MWFGALRTLLSGRILKAAALALLVLFVIAAIWNAGRDSEKAKATKTIEKSVRVSNAIQNKNRRASDSDIHKRLQQWTIKCE